MPTDSPSSEQYDSADSFFVHQWEVPLALAALSLIATIANAAGAWSVFQFGQDFEAWIAFLIGGIVAQPCLLGIWAALAHQPLIKRVFISGSMLIAMTCLYIGTLAACFDHFSGNRKLPADTVIVFVSVSAFLYGISAIALGIYRRVSGKLVHRAVGKLELAGQSQFSIKQLFVATTCIAILIPLIKWIFPTEAMPTVAPWAEFLLFSGLYLGLLISILVISSLIILRGNRSTTVFVISALLFLGGPVGINLILLNFAGPGLRGDFSYAVLYSYAFYGGAFLCLGIGLAVFRILGFELRQPADSKSR